MDPTGANALFAYDAGVVVSASHNPYRDNGLKVFDRDGGKISDTLEVAIERQVLDGGAAGGGRAGERGPDPPANRPSPLAGRHLDRLDRESVG